MGQKTKTSAGTPAPRLPRHALEGAEASGARVQSAIRRIAGRIATALQASETASPQPLNFAIADTGSGRRDSFDGRFGDDHLFAGITLDPVHVPALLIAERGVADLLVERNYGGRIEALGSARMRRPGRAETREFAALAERMAAALQASCDDRLPVSAKLIAPIDADDARELVPAGEAVAAITISMHCPPAPQPQQLTLFLPLAALRATSVLQATLAGRDETARRRWSEALQQRAGDIAMPARSVIARPMMSMGQLMALRPGDVIPITMPRQVPLLVSDRRIATGTIGERDGRVAFMIDQLEREDAR
jgi:flagellar motor switch protein FliM